MKALLRLAGWPWFKPSPADLQRLSNERRVASIERARRRAMAEAKDAAKRHQDSQPARAKVRELTTASLAAATGRQG